MRAKIPSRLVLTMDWRDAAPATFAAWMHWDGKAYPKEFADMRQIVPLVLALIPLAAVVGACVACP